jgi:putative transcriptional regulator
MAIKCPVCGAEYDVTLFAFGRRIRCSCGAWVDLDVGHQETHGDIPSAAAQDGAAGDSLQGQLLIASPGVSDADFAETVVLLVEHAADGAYGLVLNQPTDLPVKEAWAQHNDTPCLVEGLVYAGGPCHGFLTALHTEHTLSNTQVARGLYYTQAPAQLASLVERHTQPIKFFAGFAGWDAGQLESELEGNVWLTLPVLPEHVFSYGDELWAELARKILGEKTLSALKLKHRPDHPADN